MKQLRKKYIVLFYPILMQICKAIEKETQKQNIKDIEAMNT